MPWRDLVEPVRMERVAIVAPNDDIEAVLRAVAAAGLVQPELLEERAAEPSLADVLAAGVRAGSCTAIAGWTPGPTLAALAERLRACNGAVVPLPRPPGSEPPTAIARGGAGAAFAPLVDTYATVPYADLNPSLFAGLAYVVMFGMMFGDVGHGLLLLAVGLALGRRRARG